MGERGLVQLGDWLIRIAFILNVKLFKDDDLFAVLR